MPSAGPARAPCRPAGLAAGLAASLAMGWSAAAVAASASPAALPLPLRVIVDTSTAMPMAQFDQGVVIGGLHHDIGIALARRLGTTAQFAALPRKRIPVALEHGSGDLSCHYLPAWLPGAFDWSRGFLPNALVVVTGAQWPAPPSIDALRGEPVGTVLGFAYPEVHAALGAGFIRDDAGDAMQNLLKLAAGRTRHALTGEVFFAYQQRRQPILLQAQRPLLVHRYLAACAVSRRSRYPVQQIDRAIGQLQRSGQIEAIYRRYR